MRRLSIEEEQLPAVSLLERHRRRLAVGRLPHVEDSHEVFVSINGRNMYLWRAVDCEGDDLGWKAVAVI